MYASMHVFIYLGLIAQDYLANVYSLVFYHKDVSFKPQIKDAVLQQQFGHLIDITRNLPNELRLQA